MTPPKGFDERGKGMNARLRNESEERFRIEMRRNKLLAKWAAEKLGLSGPEADDYVLHVVASDFEEAGDADVRRQLLHDFQEKGVPIDEAQLRTEMSRFRQEAERQIKGG